MFSRRMPIPVTRRARSTGVRKPATPTQCAWIATTPMAMGLKQSRYFVWPVASVASVRISCLLVYILFIGIRMLCRLVLRCPPQRRRAISVTADYMCGGGCRGIARARAQIFKFNPGNYIVRIDEYGGNPSRPKWAISEATVAYYSPHTGGLFNFVDQTGFTEGRVWYVIAIDGVTRAPSPCTRTLCPVRPQPRNQAIGPPPTL
jgi:hypothetical protein